MGRRWQGACVRACREWWCSTMLMLGSQRRSVVRRYQAGGSPAMTAGCTPPLGGPSSTRGTDCRLADLEPGTTTIECVKLMRASESPSGERVRRGIRDEG